MSDSENKSNIVDTNTDETFDAKVPSLADRYSLARAHLQHEDGLVNQRVTWFLIFQGLLFTALMSGIGLLDTTKVFSCELRLFIQGALVLMTLLGIGSALVAHWLVRAAYWHMDAVAIWWNRQTTDGRVGGKSEDCFPPLRGSGIRPEQVDGGKYTAAALLIVLAGLWVILLLGLGVLLYYEHLA